MRAGLLLSFWLALFAAGSAGAAPRLNLPAATTLDPLPLGTATQSLRLERIVLGLPLGKVWGTRGSDPVCFITMKDYTWEGGREDLDVTQLEPTFASELKQAGFNAVDATDLFEDRSTDLLAGARITDIDARFCESMTDTRLNGQAVMTVEWQIYSPMQRGIVARARTRQGYEHRNHERGGFLKVLQGAFAANVRALAASDDFRKVALTARIDPATPLAPPGGLTRITLTGPRDSGARAIADASGAVVTVFGSAGMGSGFLVSSDGHLLTNQHVVGDGKYVKLRWSDGLETVGEVVRVDKRRDVALIKSDARGRTPLQLRRAAVQPGETVFAIGTPLDKKLQNSVTRGVVSGTRIFDGFNYIQSDVAVTGGNSGGPLLDEKGAAIGLTVWGVSRTGANEGINMFIPIGDALDFLAADVR